MGAADGSGPLAGRRVLVPRPPHQASALSSAVRALGGEPVEAPTITTAPGDVDELRRAVGELADGGFAGCCLTSGNAVDALATACEQAGVDGATLSRLHLLGVVGPRTAALVRERFGVEPTTVPATSTGAGLAAELPEGTGRVLLPRGDLAGTDVEHGLTERGWTPVPVVAYRTVVAEALTDDVLDQLAAGRIDLLAFTSGSTVRGFAELVGSRPWRGAAVSIGPVTSAACRELGIPVAAEADRHDLDGLLAALVRAATGPDGTPDDRPRGAGGRH